MNKIQQLEREIEHLKSAVEELSVLNEMALAVGASTDADQVLDTIVRKAVKAVKAEQGSIKLVTEEQEQPLQTLIRQQNFSGTMQVHHLGIHITGWVLKNRQPLLIADLSHDERFKTTEEERQGIHSVLCVPIWLKARILGILMVINKKTGQSFTESDLRLLSIIAAQSGQLIQNSQLQQEALERKHLQHELDLAQKIQLSMLPKTDPHLPGLDIASYFNPARSVGGDYYDYIESGSGQLALVIADVSGHGPSAALVTTLLKGVIHSIAGDLQISQDIMKRVNRIISHIIPADIFITMQLFFFDLEKMKLTYCNAGHNPPLYYDSNKQKYSTLELRACALNVLPEFDYPLEEYTIHTGDLLLVYTDGITEAINSRGEMFGGERLLQALENSTDDPPDRIIDGITKQLAAFIHHAEQADDQALVVAKVL